MQQLGLDVCVKKLIPPSTETVCTVTVCLGKQIATVESTVSIPDEKLSKIVHMVAEWRCKHFCSKRQLQCLLINLLYVSECNRASRFFLNRMLHLLCENYGFSTITLTPDFKYDLCWLDRFLKHYTGVIL